VATAVHWRQMRLAHGRAIAGKPGGDQRHFRTDAHAELIRAMLNDNGNITLAEIRSGFAAQGIGVGIGTLRRFLERHGITRKKRPGTRSNKTAPMS